MLFHDIVAFPTIFWHNMSRYYKVLKVDTINTISVGETYKIALSLGLNLNTFIKDIKNSIMHLSVLDLICPFLPVEYI
jgi:hypothetical protein